MRLAFRPSLASASLDVREYPFGANAVHRAAGARVRREPMSTLTPGVAP